MQLFLRYYKGNIVQFVFVLPIPVVVSFFAETVKRINKRVIVRVRVICVFYFKGDKAKCLTGAVCFDKISVQVNCLTG